MSAKVFTMKAVLFFLFGLLWMASFLPPLTPTLTPTCMWVQMRCNKRQIHWSKPPSRLVTSLCPASVGYCLKKISASLFRFFGTSSFLSTGNVCLWHEHKLQHKVIVTCLENIRKVFLLACASERQQRHFTTQIRVFVFFLYIITVSELHKLVDKQLWWLEKGEFLSKRSLLHVIYSLSINWSRTRDMCSVLWLYVCWYDLRSAFRGQYV